MEPFSVMPALLPLPILLPSSINSTNTRGVLAGLVWPKKTVGIKMFYKDKVFSLWIFWGTVREFVVYVLEA